MIRAASVRADLRLNVFSLELDEDSRSQGQRVRKHRPHVLEPFSRARRSRVFGLGSCMTFLNCGSTVELGPSA